MTNEALRELVKELFGDVEFILKTKGKAYSAGQRDTLYNFKHQAEELGVPVFLVWAVYFNKHLDSLRSWLKGNYSDSEPIESRILDMIVYLILLRALILDLKNLPEKETTYGKRTTNSRGASEERKKSLEPAKQRKVHVEAGRCGLSKKGKEKKEA